MDIKNLVELGLDMPKAKEIYNKMQKYINDEIKTKTKELESKLLDVQLKSAVEKQLFIAKAKNIKATTALIDFSKLDKNNIDEKSIKSMIDELKNNKETKFLFDFEDESKTKLTGLIPLNSIKNNNFNENLSYEELCKYYEKNNF